MGTSHSHGLPSDSKDYLKRNTHYSGKEITEFYKKFVREFPTGKITKREFVKSYRNSYPEKLAEATVYADHLFGGYDLDGDGIIDFKEFMITMAISLNGTPREKLEWAFNLYDINNDNELSIKEIVQIIIATQRFKGEEINEEMAEINAHAIFINLDINRDQCVSKTEFIIGAMNNEHVMNRLIG